jgi:hypothetical protein
MAQKIKPKIQTIVGIPVTVEYRAMPCKWEIKPLEDIWIDRPEGRVPERLIESDKYPPAVAYIYSEYHDPWKVRADFLGIGSDQEILDFLNQVGRFTPSMRMGWRVTGHWDVDDFRCWQRMFREFMKRSPDRWDQIVERLAVPGVSRLMKRVLKASCTFAIRFRWKGEQHSEWRGAPHLAVIESGDAVTAMLATIYLDHLHGTKFGFCARPDCGKAFEITSRHKRKFCDQYCAHLQSLRRMRTRQKTARQKLVEPSGR